MKTQTVGILTVFAYLATCLVSRPAQARVCSVPSDCPKGWDCAMVDAGTASDGVPAGTCFSLPCQSNSDCGPGLSCFIWGWSLGAGVPGGNNTPSLFSRPDGGLGSACLPQWETACTSDSDCGPGYTCPQHTGGFGGSFNCGKDQDASQPPYATVTTVPCSAVPSPLNLLGDAAPPAGFPIPSICEAGTTCTDVSWNTCVAPQTTACSVDSDCPSTWTCGCEVGCNGPILASDGSCTRVCIAPNADLFGAPICAGTSGGGFGTVGSTAPSLPGARDSGVDAAGSSATAGAASSAHGGGCQIGSESTGTSWTLIAAGALAWTRRRPRRSRRAPG